MTYDKAQNLTDNGFVKTGYKFTGWNTKSDGSGTAYTNKQSVKNLTSTDGGTISLYAQWTPITYTIKFHGNSSTGGSTASMSMTYDVAKNLTDELTDDSAGGSGVSSGGTTLEEIQEDQQEVQQTYRTF